MFDPLAVMLVIAYNQALIDRQKNFQDVESINIESASDPQMGFTALQEMEEDNERMDIIGQNGNDGLHYEDVEPNEPLEENDPQEKKFNTAPSRRGGVKIQ